MDFGRGSKQHLPLSRLVLLLRFLTGFSTERSRGLICLEDTFGVVLDVEARGGNEVRHAAVGRLL